jgi:hypothetical protein
MAIRKNKKRIDPRYFMDEKTDIIKEDLMRDEVQDLADKFNVEASVEIDSDGKPAILVTHQNGETTVYHDTEEMHRDLSDEIGRRDFGSHDWYEDESPYDAGY